MHVEVFREEVSKSASSFQMFGGKIVCVCGERERKRKNIRVHGNRPGPFTPLQREQMTGEAKGSNRSRQGRA